MREQQTIPVVIYAAKSTKDKHDSIPTQLEDCRKLSEREGWEVVSEFSDEGFSAYSGNRGRGLSDAMAECERLVGEHGTCALLVQHSDRLARGDGHVARHVVEFTLWSIKTRVRIISKQDPETFPEGDYALLMGAVAGQRNHQDSKRKSTAVRDGHRRRALDRKRPNGGPRPFGYQYDVYVEDGKPTLRLVVDEHEAAVVRRIFREYVAGRSQWQIVRDLNEEGIRSQRGGKFFQGSLSKLLRSPLYVGQFRYHAQTVPGDGSVPAIIDAETWENAQRLSSANANRSGKGRGRNPAGSHLFTKAMLRCSCGSPMTPITKPTRTPGILYETYACYGRRQHGVEFCAQEPINRELIDTAVWRFFERVGLDVDATRQAIAEQHDLKLAEFLALEARADREVAKVEEALAKIERDYLYGTLPAAAWHSLNAKLQADHEAVQAQAEQLRRQRDAIKAESDEIDVEMAVLEELTAIRAQIAGQAREGARIGTDALRAALVRLFHRFTLTSGGRFIESPEGTTPWQRKEPDLELGVADLLLWPHVRSDVIDLRSAEFPALQRAALALSDNYANAFGR